MTEDRYPIGTPGEPWGEAERTLWRRTQQIRRSYDTEVVAKLKTLAPSFALQCYGELAYPEGPYPLYALTTKSWNHALPWVLVTGGVHGYETSGVQGAIRFLAEHAAPYETAFNLAVAPCISPWGYETINRWNPLAVDPNRSFTPDSDSDEARLVMTWVADLPGEPLAHFDLHETTDTDNSEFRPALAAREGEVLDVWAIPDGFYLVGDTEAPQPEFQRAMIDAVAQVTHIAPADERGRIIGAPIAQHGVINYEVDRLGLCAGMTGAPYRTTTEVYPDSPLVDDENCIRAQVAAVCAGLDYLRANV